MPTPISDVHVARADPLPEPRLLHAELPAGEAKAAFIAASRAATFPGGRRFHFKDADGYELAVWSTD